MKDIEKKKEKRNVRVTINLTKTEEQILFSFFSEMLNAQLCEPSSFSKFVRDSLIYGLFERHAYIMHGGDYLDATRCNRSHGRV